jgi:hypothetical protein
MQRKKERGVGVVVGEDLLGDDEMAGRKFLIVWEKLLWRRQFGKWFNYLAKAAGEGNRSRCRRNWGEFAPFA